MRIWLSTVPNPLQLPEPPGWWQTLVFDYDKMLRLFPSQREHLYRLCRVVRREARLGLQTMVVHEHPDTRIAIQHGIVPIAGLYPWAITSTKIIRDLRDRDLWRLYNGDVNQLLAAIERGEHEAEQAQERERDAAIDESNTSAFRAIKYGRPESILVGHHARPASPRDLQNRNRVSSPANRPPPAGAPPATARRIVLTDAPG